MTDLVPGGNFWMKNHFWVLGKLQVGKYGPWVKSLKKITIWPLEFESLAEKVPGYKKWKINFHDPWNIHMWQELPCEYFGEVAKPVPRFLEFTKMILVF